MTDQYDGIVNPPIDTLLERVDSKYALVLFAAKRARPINAYYSQLHEGLFEYVGPLVETQLNEKPLSISLREIESDLLVSREVSDQPVEIDFGDEEFGDFTLPGDEDPFATEAEAGAESANATTNAEQAAEDAGLVEQAEAAADEQSPADVEDN